MHIDKAPEEIAATNLRHAGVKFSGLLEFAEAYNKDHCTQDIMSITKSLNIIGKSVLLLALLFGGYAIALHLDMKKVDNFCSEMRAGLDVNRIAEIANKYDVGFKHVRDTTSVAKEELGIKLNDRANTWLFVVGAPMTVGEHACGVYHNNEVVLEAKLRQ